MRTFLQRKQEYVHASLCSGQTLGHTGLVTDLNLQDSRGFHLVQEHTHVASVRAVVDTNLVVGQPRLIPLGEVVGEELQHVEQRLFPAQIHPLRVERHAVRTHVDNRQLLLCKTHLPREQQPRQHIYPFLLVHVLFCFRFSQNQVQSYEKKLILPNILHIFCKKICIYGIFCVTLQPK